jgi:hypothetical protein
MLETLCFFRSNFQLARHIKFHCTENDGFNLNNIPLEVDDDFDPFVDDDDEMKETPPRNTAAETFGDEDDDDEMNDTRPTDTAAETYV